MRLNRLNVIHKNICKNILAVAVGVIAIAYAVTPVYASDMNKGDSTKNTTSIPSSVPNPTLYSVGTYHVSKDGTKDFTSIASAVALVPSGSTLIIHEGVYNEAITNQTKIINMRGTSRENSVLQFDTCNYVQVPLNIAGGTYENMTIYGYHRTPQTGAFPGYAIHIDCDTLTGQAVNFNNCNIISENAFCVGIGLRRGARIAFRGCTFTSKKQGVMLFHDSQNPALAGNANITIDGCLMNNSADGLIITQCLSPASTTNLTLRGNRVVGNGDGYCRAFGASAGNGNGWMGAGNVLLTSNSSGNSIQSFNYSDFRSHNPQIPQAAGATQNMQTAGSESSQVEAYARPIAPGQKFYTLTTEDGREVNVPADSIDGF